MDRLEAKPTTPPIALVSRKYLTTSDRRNHRFFPMIRTGIGKSSFWTAVRMSRVGTPHSALLMSFWLDEFRLANPICLRRAHDASLALAARMSRPFRFRIETSSIQRSLNLPILVIVRATASISAAKQSSS